MCSVSTDVNNWLLLFFLSFNLIQMSFAQSLQNNFYIAINMYISHALNQYEINYDPLSNNIVSSSLL